MVPRLARRFPFASGNLAFHRRRCHGCRSNTACRPLTAASCACTPCSGKTQLSVHTKKARLVSQRQETRTGERMIVRAATLPASAAASLLRILASRGLPTRLNSAITKPSLAILCRCGGRGAVVSTLQQAQHKADQQLHLGDTSSSVFLSVARFNCNSAAWEGSAGHPCQHQSAKQ